jgi:hypothetical protein
LQTSMDENILNFDVKSDDELLTPLAIKILEKCHIQFSDVVLCALFPRLEPLRQQEFCQELHVELSKLK